MVQLALILVTSPLMGFARVQMLGWRFLIFYSILAQIDSNNGSEEAETSLEGEGTDDLLRLRLAAEETSATRRLNEETGGAGRGGGQLGDVEPAVETPKKLHLGLSKSLEVNFQPTS